MSLYSGNAEWRDCQKFMGQGKSSQTYQKWSRMCHTKASPRKPCSRKYILTELIQLWPAFDPQIPPFVISSQSILPFTWINKPRQIFRLSRLLDHIHVKAPLNEVSLPFNLSRRRLSLEHGVTWGNPDNANVSKSQSKSIPILVELSCSDCNESHKRSCSINVNLSNCNRSESERKARRREKQCQNHVLGLVRLSSSIVADVPDLFLEAEERKRCLRCSRVSLSFFGGSWCSFLGHGPHYIIVSGRKWYHLGSACRTARPNKPWFLFFSYVSRSIFGRRCYQLLFHAFCAHIKLPGLNVSSDNEWFSRSW
jgi:hypothetical protein